MVDTLSRVLRVRTGICLIAYLFVTCLPVVGHSQDGCSKRLTKRPSQTYLGIQAAAKNGFADWKQSPEAGPGWETSWSWRLPFNQLTSKETENLRKALRKNDPTLSQVPWVLKIALDPKDAKAWVQLFEFTTETPSWENGIMALEPLFSEMPSTTKQFLLSRIGQKYPTAAKFGKHPNRMLLAPKRCLDLWLRYLLPAPEIFAANYLKTKNALLAYQSYFDELNSRVLSEINPNPNLYGRLSADDVYQLALAAQRALAGLAADGSYWAKNQTLFLHGSVTKGLAKRGSDIDVLLAKLAISNEGDYTMYGIKYREFKDTQQISYDQRTPAFQMNEVANSRFREMGLTFSAPADGSQQFGLQSKMEPFFIAVTAKGIALLMPLNETEQDAVYPDAEIVECSPGVMCARYEFPRVPM